MKKYKMIPEGRMFRIVALVDIPMYKIKKGDHGGLVQNEDNLSQRGSAWIYRDAQVYGNAQVYGDAQVYDDAQVYSDAQVYGDALVCGNAQIYGNARVCGNAQVYGNVRVYGNALVYGNTQVYGNARVCGNTQVYGNTQVCGNARVCGDALVCGNAQVWRSEHITPVINMVLNRHSITIDGHFINIGCQSHTVAQWLRHYKKLGIANGYSEEQIKEYASALRFIKRTYFKGVTDEA